MKHLLPLLFLLLVSTVACDNSPNGILSPSKMEEVLYDYHIMQGIIEQLPADNRLEEAQKHINAVYEKHGITEAQFDTSVVYYNRHPKDLYKIYGNLKERYTTLNQEIQLMNGNNDMMAVFTTGGDTTNLWNTSKLLALHNKELLNKQSFTIHADTSFRDNDQLILTFTPTLIKENYDDQSQLMVGLSIIYANGKHTGETRMIDRNTTIQMTAKANGTANIKDICGFFYYRGQKGKRGICLVDNISLVRMHEQVEATETKEDTIDIDTLANDTIAEPSRRLTPEEIRLQNKSNDKIDITAAPSVRRPNSVGPRRKKQKQR